MAAYCGLSFWRAVAARAATAPRPAHRGQKAPVPCRSECRYSFVPGLSGLKRPLRNNGCCDERSRDVETRKPGALT